MTKKGKDILIIIGGIVSLLIILLVPLLFSKNKNNIKGEILTDKREYKQNQVLMVKIKNESTRDICFSSCYPYYFERKNKGWQKYPYEKCPNKDVASQCLAPKKTKLFELSIPPIIGKGIHRLAIPVCFGCSQNDKFRNDKWFYSNQFIIK